MYCKCCKLICQNLVNFWQTFVVTVGEQLLLFAVARYAAMAERNDGESADFVRAGRPCGRNSSSGCHAGRSDPEQGTYLVLFKIRLQKQAKHQHTKCNQKHQHALGFCAFSWKHPDIWCEIVNAFRIFECILNARTQYSIITSKLEVAEKDSEYLAILNPHSSISRGW